MALARVRPPRSVAIRWSAGSEHAWLLLRQASATLPSVRVVFSVWVWCWLVATSALAEPSPQTDADRLFDEGRALAAAGDFAAACTKFAESLELDHSLGTMLNLADCHEKQDHLREAWRLFTAVALESARSADTKRTTYARERATSVAAKLVTIVIQVERPMIGMSITVADRPVEPSMQIIDLVEPGATEIRASVPRHPPFTKTVDGVAGATVHVTIPPFEEPAETTTRYERQRGRVYLAIGLGVGSVVVGGTAFGFALKGRSDYNTVADGDHCDRVGGGIRCDAVGTAAIHDAQRLANIGTIGAITGGALGIAAIVVFATAPMNAIEVAPTVTRDRVGLVFSRSF